jgi:cell division protein FtsI (penicillin-binding protein 3)
MIGTVFSLLFLSVTCRAFYLQILQHEELVKKAERQHQHIVQLTPVRGAIFDCNGTPMAVSLDMGSCYAEPRRIRDAEGTAALLAPILGVSKQELTAKLSSDKGFVWVERLLAPETAARIKGLKLPGIGFVTESKRFYPNSEIASHVIGFTGVDPVGLEGIERRYDTLILGNTGYMVTERDALGREIGTKGEIIRNASPGKNLVLTLDKNIQYIVEKELARAVAGSGAKNGMALVMEPATGRVLAMANYPTFNPNATSLSHAANLRNRVVADSFEPGSTFKMFLVAAALEEKVVRQGDVFNCENGKYVCGGKTIHDTHPFARLSVTDILKHSSNIGAAKIGLRLGDERLYRYLRSFGFGERTGIDLPGEASGLMRNNSHWGGVDLATISFGQGVSASAIQLAAAASAIANGGILMKPYLVQQIIDDNGREMQRFEPQQVRRVISGETAARVTRMLESVTSDGGTGSNAAVDGFRVAGKTGTAQKADPVTHGYSGTKRTASFIGFIPADKPRLTILVVVDEPKTSPYGGVVAAPAFREIAVKSLAYLKVLPTTAAGESIRPGVTATAQSTEQPDSEPVAPESSSEGLVMPDFRGMSMRRVMQVMEKRKINIRLKGSGRATEQNPLPGHTIRGGDEVWVTFAPSA